MEDVRMGFFSELKSDLSQAVNTLMPEDKLAEADNLDKENQKEDSAKELRPEKVDIDSMLNRLDDIKLDDIGSAEDEEKVSEEVEKVEEIVDESVADEPETVEPEETPVEETVEEPAKEAEDEAAEIEELEQKIEEQTAVETAFEEPKSAIEAINSQHIDEYIAESNVSDTTTNYGGEENMEFEQQTPTDETASITEGMVINGDIQTTGSLDLVGKVTGNIQCLGKLNVTGEITGDSEAAEIYAEAARITGEVKSKGSVKVGQSTVIVGNIFGSSAVIAGAVKGDIDVHGPVVLDTTAIVMGNIKSQSVQINNGAVIEGMCSQAYADVNPSEFFEGLKNK